MGSVALYMVVKNDGLELPLIVGTLKECSEYLGITENTFKSTISHHKNKYKEWRGEYKYFRVLAL